MLMSQPVRGGYRKLDHLPRPGKSARLKTIEGHAAWQTLCVEFNPEAGSWE